VRRIITDVQPIGDRVAQNPEIISKCAYTTLQRTTYTQHRTTASSTEQVKPMGDRVAQNPEIISKTFSTNRNSAHGIYD